MSLVSQFTLGTCFHVTLFLFGFLIQASSAATNIPYTYCPTDNQVFNISYVYVTDNADGADACVDGSCKIVGGHTYTIVGEGCGGNPGELMTSLKFEVLGSTDLTIPLLGTPLISDYTLLNGDLCAMMRPSNETTLNGHAVGNCPARSPSCAKFQILYQAPFFPALLPYTQFISFGARITGRAWINADSTDNKAAAAVCGQLQVSYSPIG